MRPLREYLLEVENVTVDLGGKRRLFGGVHGAFRAVANASFGVGAGEIFGLIGESGSGKTTLGRTVLGLQRELAGVIKLDGTIVSGLDNREARRARRAIQYVHQDAAAALDPWWSIGRSLREALLIQSVPADQRNALTLKALADVDLDPRTADRFPHEFSGGQLRRIAIARILLMKPRLVILDEPTAGLDMSVQATVLKLILELRSRFGLSFLFISHDLSVVKRICDRVAIMRRGEIVEQAHTSEVFYRPSHEYTRRLLDAVPTLTRKRGRPQDVNSTTLTAD